MVWHNWFIEELKNEMHHLRIGERRERKIEKSLHIFLEQETINYFLFNFLFKVKGIALKYQYLKDHDNNRLTGMITVLAQEVLHNKY